LGERHRRPRRSSGRGADNQRPRPSRALGAIIATNRHDDKRDAVAARDLQRVALLLVTDELRDDRNQIDETLEVGLSGLWEPFRLRSWDEHKEAATAVLSTTEWLKVSNAYNAMQRWNDFQARFGSNDDPKRLRALRQVLQAPLRIVTTALVQRSDS
jgi:hypothetical protein